MSNLPEPWLRGTHTEVHPIQRAVLHALELANEDIERWCGELSDEEFNARPHGLAPVAFHLRHIARSTDRLLSYAEGNHLTDEQIATMKTELDEGASREEVFAEFKAALEKSAVRVRALYPTLFDKKRGVGKKQLPTTIGGLLVHVADHAQRHVGQAITTTKIVTAARDAS